MILIHPGDASINLSYPFPGHKIVAAGHLRKAYPDPAPQYGVWKSNANLLTSNEPPYDPAMGTYQLRALLCRIAMVEAVD